MYSKVHAAAVFGMEGRLISVEADITDGMPLFSMVGFLSSEVREAKERVRSALHNAGISIPPKRITINLAPADMRKEGAGFDLPVAASVLAALGFISPESLEKVLIVGELGLDGQVNAISGILPMVLAAKQMGCQACIIPHKNGAEGRAVNGISVVTVLTLKDMLRYFMNPQAYTVDQDELGEHIFKPVYDIPDFSDVCGQEGPKRAALIAAGGFHNLLLTGPPGAGKSMIAKRLPGILPPLTIEESMEVAKIYSVAGMMPGRNPKDTRRPFRAPHHTASPFALAGGGRNPKPGEISLAHLGVLYLDELTEHKRETLEILRQPLEDGEIHIVRTHGTYVFPADFLLVAAMNLCPCGNYPDMDRCCCAAWQIQRYVGKISQPLLDRIDISVDVPRTSYQELTKSGGGEPSASLREKVMKAHEIQRERYKGTGIRSNAGLSSGLLREYCLLGPEEEDLLKSAFEKLKLSARSYHRIIKVARTIADLDGQSKISKAHVAEAISWRGLDRNRLLGGV